MGVYLRKQLKYESLNSIVTDPYLARLAMSASQLRTVCVVGRRGTGQAGDLSMRLALAVERKREDLGMSVQRLIADAGFSASYFYSRMNGSAPFNANDIERLSGALECAPEELVQMAFDDGRTGGQIRVDGGELSRRLGFLQVNTAVADGGFDFASLLAHAASADVDLTPELWATLNEESGALKIDELVLEAVADYFDVQPAYLIQTGSSVIADRVEAELEFAKALRDKGVKKISARTVGEVSPAALRSIATAIRAIKPRGSLRKPD